MKLVSELELGRCPQCHIDRPRLISKIAFDTSRHSGGGQRFWNVYVCASCGGVVTANSSVANGDVNQIFPEPSSVDGAINETAREYLNQCMNSLHAPAGAVLLAASAVDAMLKDKG